MLKYLKKFRANMTVPIISKVLTKFAIGLILSILWDRFINASAQFMMVKHVFFFFGLIYLGLAWFNFLKMDGMKFHYLNEDRHKDNKPKHKQKAMVDFTDEDRDDIDSFDSDEKLLAAFLSNIITGLFFMIPCLTAIAFF